MKCDRQFYNCLEWNFAKSKPESLVYTFARGIMTQDVLYKLRCNRTNTQLIVKLCLSKKQE